MAQYYIFPHNCYFPMHMVQYNHSADFQTHVGDSHTQVGDSESDDEDGTNAGTLSGSNVSDGDDRPDIN